MTVRELIDRWPDLPGVHAGRRSAGRSSFARDIGVPVTHVNTMIARNSIPPKYWEEVVQAAKRRKIAGVDFATLAQLAARKV